MFQGLPRHPVESIENYLIASCLSFRAATAAAAIYVKQKTFHVWTITLLGGNPCRNLVALHDIGDLQ